MSSYPEVDNVFQLKYPYISYKKRISKSKIVSELKKLDKKNVNYAYTSQKSRDQIVFCLIMILIIILIS